MINPEQFYQTRSAELASAIATLEKQANHLARLRLLVALAFIVPIYFSFTLSLHFLWLSLGLAVVFFRLVQRHADIKEEAHTMNVMRTLCMDEVRLMNGDVNCFDGGDAGHHKDSIYAVDLDILGGNSLLRAINRTTTRGAQKMLVDTLLNPPDNTGTIDHRRQTINELQEHLEWRQRFFAIGSMSGETAEDVEQVRKWVAQLSFFENRSFWFIIAALAGAASMTVIGWMIYQGALYLLPLLVLIVVNNSLYAFIARDAGNYFKRFGDRTLLYKKFGLLFGMIDALKLASPLGVDLTSQIKEAHNAFGALAKLSNLAEQRANGLVTSFMNTFFLFDIWTIRRLEKWRMAHGHQTIEWIHALNQVDLLNSMANFRFNHPSFCDAEIVDSHVHINAVAMSHPLINATVAVANDYSIGNGPRAHIITGSNMAGKSTFIRAVGLNVVLALNGMPVSARKFSCSILSIASCIRITDSLEDHASYFKAELDRLARIISLLQSGKPYLVLLDEILRGTNSDDKRQGTLLFYQKLMGFNCLSLLATHDLHIGQLHDEHPEHFTNYCFESEVRGSELVFDYKLRTGVSKSANATFLMRKLKLID